MGTTSHRTVESGSAITAKSLNQIRQQGADAYRPHQLTRGTVRANFLAQTYKEGPKEASGKDILDFCDARYWVRQVRILSKTLPPTCYPTVPMGKVAPEFDLETSIELISTSQMTRWLPAVNLAELESNTHSVPEGTLVQVFEIIGENDEDPGAATRGKYQQILAFNHFITQKTVIIEAVIESTTQPGIQQEQIDNFNFVASKRPGPESGEHVSCYEIKADGTTNTNKRIPVLPQGTQNQVRRWRNSDGTQIFNYLDPDSPWWVIRPSYDGLWEFDFAIDEILALPPDPSEICP